MAIPATNDRGPMPTSPSGPGLELAPSRSAGLTILHLSRAAETLWWFLIPTMEAQQRRGHTVILCTEGADAGSNFGGGNADLVAKTAESTPAGQDGGN